MKTVMPNGIFPVMITPFTDDNEVDYPALAQLTEWYINNGVHGLFAVCLSSEMTALSLKERVEVARFVTKQVAGRVPVVASGHISDSFSQQIDEIKQISQTGIDSFVLVTNRLALQGEDEQVVKRNIERILERFPDLDFGLYECPVPYHRLFSPELLKWCGETGRFNFLKECSNNLEQILAKVEAVKGTPLKVYIANSSRLLDVLKSGGNGYSGILANYHPDLYVWLTENWDKQPDKAVDMQNFIGPSTLFETRFYPMGAKHYLQLEGVPMSVHCRTKDASTFTLTHREEIRQFRLLNQFMKKTILTEA